LSSSNLLMNKWKNIWRFFPFFRTIWLRVKKLVSMMEKFGSFGFQVDEDPEEEEVVCAPPVRPVFE